MIKLINFVFISLLSARFEDIINEQCTFSLGDCQRCTQDSLPGSKTHALILTNRVRGFRTVNEDHRLIMDKSHIISSIFRANRWILMSSISNLCVIALA